MADMYSAEEVGYIALQCPEHEHYHVQAENLLVEILDESDRPCPPGAIGRVVLSTLHNFAMPLIRYEIGDYAEPGEPCPCGRGLPVIRRILGRERNLMACPDGQRRFPVFPAGNWMHIAPIRQIQIVQKTVDHLELRLAISTELRREEQEELKGVLRKSLGFPFRFTFAYYEEIPSGPGGKYEDFICEVSTLEKGM